MSFARGGGISRTTFYEEVKDKKLILRKIRGRSIVTADDEAAWIKTLPVFESMGEQK